MACPIFLFKYFGNMGVVFPDIDICSKYGLQATDTGSGQEKIDESL
jgi:hypothetical protein